MTVVIEHAPMYVHAVWLNFTSNHASREAGCSSCHAGATEADWQTNLLSMNSKEANRFSPTKLQEENAWLHEANTHKWFTGEHAAEVPLSSEKCKCVNQHCMHTHQNG